MSSAELHFFRGYSLVDITSTGDTRSIDDENLRRNQQRNWETVLQCIGIIAQPLHIQMPKFYIEPLETMNFGELYKGIHRVWSWSWATEAENVYDLPDKPLSGLYFDFEQIPIITNLTETARFMLPIFHPYGAIKNIYFERISQ